MGEVESYANSEDAKLERKLQYWHWAHNIGNGITLEGSTAGPDRGMVYYQGRPLCAEDASDSTTWNIQAAKVICRMLGYSGASQFSEDTCPYGSCPPARIPFAMSGFK